MSIIGQRSLVRARMDSSGGALNSPVRLGPSAGASGSETAVRLAIIARHLAVARDGAVPGDQCVTRAPSSKIA